MGDFTGLTIKCEREWTLGERIGGGGFGEVYEARSVDGAVAAIKLVPAVSGADRELLFTSLDDVPNVVPIIDKTAETRLGETHHDGPAVRFRPWPTPRASRSLARIR